MEVDAGRVGLTRLSGVGRRARARGRRTSKDTRSPALRSTEQNRARPLLITDADGSASSSGRHRLPVSSGTSPVRVRRNWN